MTRTIDTLGKAARHGMILRADCGCGNIRYFRCSDLASVLGGGRDPRSVKFRCEACRPKVKVTVLELDRDRMPKITVWKPDIASGSLKWRPERLK